MPLDVESPCGYEIVRLATKLRLRPLDGYEHFLSWGQVHETLLGSGMILKRERGLHLFPFQLPLHRVSRWCDRRLQVLRGGMINLCVLAEKPPFVSPDNR